MPKLDFEKLQGNEFKTFKILENIQLEKPDHLDVYIYNSNNQAENVHTNHLPNKSAVLIFYLCVEEWLLFQFSVVSILLKSGPSRY